VIVLTVLISAVMLLIWNGSTFFHRLPLADSRFGPDIRIASTALTLNVALILFGWRRYVDLQHESEMRDEQERRATVLATTDPITGVYNRKGFADRAGQLCAEAAERGDDLVVISFQVHRFKLINDQHGYETGEGEHPPADRNAIIKSLQPFVHGPPGNGCCDNKRNEHQFQKVFRQ